MADPEFSHSQLSGMTVNERLSAFDLFPLWDEAAKQRNRSVMISILRKVSLTEEDASSIADTILNDPKKYGF